jgi:hypothetical protein
MEQQLSREMKAYGKLKHLIFGCVDIRPKHVPEFRRVLTEINNLIIVEQQQLTREMRDDGKLKHLIFACVSTFDPSMSQTEFKRVPTEINSLIIVEQQHLTREMRDDNKKD